VVENLEAKGAVFVDELEEVPADVPVIFSAHGVPKSVPEEAERRNLLYLDATCPLVSKVHVAAERHFRSNRHIILIGHAGHPEVIGTMGQLTEDAISLVETVDDIPNLKVPKNKDLAYITQTTLSLDDTKLIIEALENQFPKLIGPAKQDICYATTNRQQAVKIISEGCDAVLVIGAPNSSNSKRLVEVAAMNGCPDSKLIQRASDIDWTWLATKKVVGITAGASAPEVLVEEVLKACAEKFNVAIEEVAITREDVIFKLPKKLTD
jgi:4-hydroxy-3-methylbut-2-enyl diphosphate reductase